jgi:hypothetical protein
MHDRENYLAFDHSISQNKYNKIIMVFCNFYFYSFYKLFLKIDSPLQHTFNICDLLIMWNIYTTNKMKSLELQIL